MAGMHLSPSSLPYNVNRTPTVCSSRYLKSSPTFSSHSKCNLTPRNPWISGAVNSSNVQLQLVNSFACKPYSCPRFPFAHRGRFVQVGFANPQNPLVNGGALDNAVGSEEQGWRNKLEQIGDILSTAFPLWVALACVAGLVRPTAFLWIRGNWQIGGLTLTMLGLDMLGALVWCASGCLYWVTFTLNEVFTHYSIVQGFCLFANDAGSNCEYGLTFFKEGSYKIVCAVVCLLGRTVKAKTYGRLDVLFPS
eukprot:Gb_18833 [translate_table: standard]